MPVYPSGGTIAQSVGSPGFGPAPTPSYNASASVRFNPADSANISFTPTLQGSRTTWTMAFWFKRSSLSSRQLVVSNLDTSAVLGWGLELNASDQLDIYDFNNPTFVTRLITTQVFRDVSAWYHLTLVYDSTQATSSNRLKLYINGAQVTAFGTATYPAQYYLGYWNRSGVLCTIGKAGLFTSGSTYFYGGYLADMNFVDGLALTPSSFTATDANTGQLVPAQYTGSFGINGFYLPFSGAALAVDLGQNPKTTGQDFPYWPYNTLLVNTTSTNGAQNNTFLDSSTNNFTITRNGNTTQGNFTPFNYGGGTAQANGYYSGYFDSTGDYLSLPASGNASYINGTGNFTIDFWVYYNALPTGSIGANTGCSWYAQDSGLAIVSPFNLIQAGNTWYLYADTGAGTWNIFSQVTIATTTLSAGQWYHVACVRDSTNIRLYINGVQVGTASIGAASIWQNTVRNLYLFGAWQNTAGSTGLNGYVSNYRLVKGTCLYPNGTTFTVPTTPLTAIANTSLLTCQSSQFIDNSTNAFAITTFGNSQPLPTNPFGMTAWSGYFDGTGDYLTVPSATATTLDADFTIEYFMYRPAAGNNWILTLGDAFLSSGIETYIGTSGTAFNLYSNNAVRITSSTLPAVGVWSHVAMVRSGSTVTLYLNGVSLGTWTSSATFSGITYIGAERYNGSITGVFTGYLSNVRIVKGTAVYTANFTPPTATLTAISGTSLLTCQSSTFIDNSPNAFAITVNGNPYTLTLNNPFNSPVNYTTPPVQAWSAYNPVNATVDQGRGYITLPTSTNLALGAGDFSIEFWVNQNVPVGVYGSICGNLSATAGSFTLRTTTNSGAGTGPLGLVFGNTAGDLFTTGLALRLNQWHHVVVCRTSGTISCFVDGIRLSSVASTYNFSLGSGVEIFRSNTLSNLPLVGWLSNLRIVKGTSPYNAGLTTLTVPSGPLTAITGTQLLALQSNALVDNSPNRFPLTLVTVAAPGITPVTPNSPFFPTTAWSAASYGGTMYFDGSDYLSAPANAAFAFGTGNFTIEAWVYTPATQTQYAAIACNANNPDGWFLSFGTTNLVTFSNWNVTAMTSSSAVPLGAWTHVAVSRSGTSLWMFFNGQQVASATNSTTYGVAGTTNYIGFNSQTHYVSGYISGLRILKGTALYTTPFVPPVLPPTAIANTSLLLNATNAGIYDATGDNVLETVGNAQVSTAVKKWGTSSMFFDGNGDYIVQPTSASYGYGTGDFTIEFWLYLNITSLQTIVSNLSTASSTNPHIYISTTIRYFTTGVDRIIGASLNTTTWYHIAVCRVSGSTRLFINGTQSGSTYADANNYGTTAPLGIGTYWVSGVPYTLNTFNGYIQDLRITRGVGRYSGNFTPPAAAFAYNQYDIGNQQWTPNNISVTAGVGKDNLVDSPSDYGTDTGLGGQVRGNYATLNPLQNGGVTLTNGNLDGTSAPANWITTYATIGISSGKWYWEGTCTRSSANEALMGIVKAGATLSSYVGFDANGWCYYTSASSSLKINNASTSAYGAIYTTGDVIGVALDLDAGTLVFYKNGVSQGTAYSSLSGQFFPAISVISNSAWVMNFGQRAFAYAAPSGFKCLVSTNLPTPTIGTTSSTRADDYFNALIYTGNDVSGRTITGVGFQPDLVWIKARNQAYSNQVTDVVRGPSKALLTNSTSAELPNRTVGYVSAFASNGFTVTAGSTDSAEVNQSGTTYVAWNWKANGAGVANTAGTIPSTVSANTTSGVSIVTYTSQSSGSGTIGHGLGVAPTMIITKPLTGSVGWSVYHESLGNLAGLGLNTTGGLTSSPTYWNSTSPTTTVFSQGSAFAGLGTMVAYCFANVPGFSSLGSFTANSSADNAFVYTGFAPRFIMVKVTTAGTNGNWVIFDTARNPTNIVGFEIYPNSSAAEAYSADLDILSNGFKLRNAGFVSGIWIYAAFAEFPFKYSRAR